MLWYLLLGVAHGYLQLDFERSNNAENLLAKRDDALDPTVLLKNVDSLEYTMQVQVGSPPQNISVQLDTGSSDLWLVGSDNPYCKENKKYAPKKKQEEALPDDGFPTSFDQVTKKMRTLQCVKGGGLFNLSNSSTYKSNDSSFLIVYGDNSFAKGGLGTDILSFGSFNTTDLLFGVANFTTTETGVLGVGLPYDESTYNVSYNGTDKSQSYTYDNFPLILKKNGVIDKIAYSVYLNASSSTGGTILFGALDHSKYTGDLVTLPLARRDVGSGSMEYPDPYELSVVWTGLYFNDTGLVKNVTGDLAAYRQLRKRADDVTDDEDLNLIQNSTVALLDTGTTITYMPQDLIDVLTQIVNGTVDEKTNFIKLKKCPKKNDYRAFTFEFDNAQVVVPYNSIISKKKGKCYLEVGVQQDTGEGDGDFAILGDNFLSHAYVVYNLEDYEISIAQANYSPGSPDIEQIVEEVPSATRASAYSSDSIVSNSTMTSAAPRVTAASNKTNATNGTNGTNGTNSTRKYLQRRANVNSADSLKSSGYIATAILAAAAVAMFL
ncbi:pepsin-like aspartic protease RNJ42_00191 [Nakaseomyces bracarensis]|uniref:pepsin-like aspartic protease n=1 Tax=Nakaseomyces bracarensis TaxID=273131 RepID=UPI00387164AA